MRYNAFDIRRQAATLLSSLIAVAVLAAPQVAQAQTVTNYTFTVPVAQVVVNPCTTGFESLLGNLTVSVTTIQATDFTFGLTIASSGQGDDALANGTLILNGTQKPRYLYSSSVDASTNFPNGRPTYFSQTLNITDYLQRSPKPTPSDSFLLNVNLQLVYNNGVPTAPVINKIQVACG